MYLFCEVGRGAKISVTWKCRERIRSRNEIIRDKMIIFFNSPKLVCHIFSPLPIKLNQQIKPLQENNLTI
jgi:hypothetical protein